MLPASYCPDCGYKLEGATGIENRSHKPSPGDVSICFNCTTFLQFDNSLHLVLLPSTRNLPEETSNMLFKARRTIHQMRREKQ